MLNKIILHGRLTADPELRYTQSQTPVASFTLAVDRDYTPQGSDGATDFIPCVAWRKTAEFVSKWFHKGSLVLVCGRLQLRDYKDRDGNAHRATEVNAESVYFGESRRSAEAAPAAPSYPTASRPVDVAPPFEELDDQGELPF